MYNEFQHATMILNKCIKDGSYCQLWQVEDCVIRECAALKVFSSTCRTGLSWTLEENEQTKEQQENDVGSAAALNTCLPRVLSSAILYGRAAQSQSTTWRGVMSTSRTLGKSHKVLEESVMFLLSVRRNALLSELFRHSHQVSGVWVSKTVRRNF